MPSLIPEPPLHLPGQTVMTNASVVSKLESFGGRAREIADEVRQAANGAAIFNPHQILLEKPDVITAEDRITLNYRQFTVTFFNHHIGNNVIIGTPNGEMMHAIWRKTWLGVFDNFEHSKKICKIPEGALEKCSKEGLSEKELEALFSVINSKLAIIKK